MAKNKEELPSEKPPIVMGSPDWSDFVMQKFEPDELFEGNPTVDGLRRVASLVLGQIIESDINLLGYRHANDGSPFVTCKCAITVKKANGDLAKFSELAETHFFNVSEDYRKYLVAVCATRAEARTLRKMLMLKKVVAVEELDSAVPDPEFITASQIQALKTIGQRIDVDVWAYMNSGEKQYVNLKEVPYSKAINMIQHFNSWQQDATKIKPEFIGYKKGWELDG